MTKIYIYMVKALRHPKRFLGERGILKVGWDIK